MHESKDRSLFVAADGHGLLGLWEELNKDWRGAIENYPHVRFSGFEFYPWAFQGLIQNAGGSLDRQVMQARRNGVLLAAIHMRTGGVHDVYGWFNRSKLFLLNEAMLPTIQAMREIGCTVEYGVLHAPEARNGGLMQCFMDDPRLLPYMLIENHGHVGSDGTALSVARDLHDLEVPAGVMFDLMHSYQCTHYLDTDATRRIDMLLKNLKWVLESAVVGDITTVGLHVPMGTDLSDALPYGIRKQILKEIVAMVNDPRYKPMVKFVTIEGQRNLPDALVLCHS